ncbi:tryptophan halogenase [Sphingomonas kaistensis]|uniref:Tryptophan halogenase n=1 Tax=Sphingomonas kaistensis TaxID=298708 RepID=A0A7X5Y319_9SPHN|nr:tryptophan halogenase [Sphingomonas kaistensis]
MQRISKVVIVGGGTAGWMSAALLGRTFGRTLDITLVESDEIGTVGVGEATIPPILVYNQALGIDEAEFLRETRGTIKLGIEFQNWGTLGHRYMHAFGDVGHYHGLSPFVHYFLRAKAAGLADRLGDYSLGERAAYAGRFGHLPRVPNTPLAGLNYAYHFDAGLYARYLRRIAEGHGVTRQEGLIQSVERDGESGHVQSVVLADGSRIEGELFLDCSGFRALLIGEAMGVDCQDWTHWLPADRAWAVPTENVGEPRPYTQSIAHQAGWQWRIPLQHRTGNGHVFASAFMGEDEARDVLLANLEGKPIAEPRLLKFTTGRRERFWEKNVVSIGLSSGFLEPLESTSIHLIQSAVVKLSTLFPDAGFDPAYADEFNRQMTAEFDGVRDFIILHYHANQRTDAPMWTACREMAVPDSLKDRIDLFRDTGRIFRHGRELFHEVGWLQVMLGQGIEPRRYDHMADALPQAELDAFLANLKTVMAGTVSRLPTHRQFLEGTGAKLEAVAA